MVEKGFGFTCKGKYFSRQKNHENFCNAQFLLLKFQKMMRA